MTDSIIKEERRIDRFLDSLAEIIVFVIFMGVFSYLVITFINGMTMEKPLDIAVETVKGNFNDPVTIEKITKLGEDKFVFYVLYYKDSKAMPTGYAVRTEGDVLVTKEQLTPEQTTQLITSRRLR